MVDQTQYSELTGTLIREIFKSVKEIADLHACLASPRGGYFRLRLLQRAGTPLTEEAVACITSDSSVNESRRHLNMLVNFQLLGIHEIDAAWKYARTPLGERAVNALREFERRVTTKAAQLIYESSLGPNSIRLFLKVYGDKRNANLDELQIRYTLEELTRLSLFLPRAIERLSAIDRLNEADLLAYRDDGYVYLHPTKARSFYQYLLELYEIKKEIETRSNADYASAESIKRDGASTVISQ